MVNSVIKKVDTTVFSIWGVLRLAHCFMFTNRKKEETVKRITFVDFYG